MFSAPPLPPRRPTRAQASGTAVTLSRSKLPEVGTTIFTVMSRRARELGALNLGQGFPDYDIDPRLTALVGAAMAAATSAVSRGSMS